MPTLNLPADKEHVLAVALWHAVEGDSSMLDRLVSEMRATHKREPDPRLHGLEYAESIADHWHQRFLMLRSEMPKLPSMIARNSLADKAEGAKQVLDDIRAERLRLAVAAP